MKRFQFRAAKVLDLRQRQHEQAVAEKARAQGQRDVAAAALSDAERATTDAEEAYRARLVAGDSATILQRHRNWISGKHAGTESCRRQVAQRDLEVERAAADVRSTHRQSRVLERLRDRAWDDYQDETKRVAAIEMDQLAVIQYARRMTGATK